ncbi:MULTISPECIES: hypothetical protein [unclassified Limnothrix]|nr:MULTISPECIES: hypothetical protein [unclassified Limnothrix]
MPVLSMFPEHREEINRVIVPGFGDRARMGFPERSPRLAPD